MSWHSRLPDDSRTVILIWEIESPESSSLKAKLLAAYVSRVSSVPATVAAAEVGRSLTALCVVVST